MPVAKNYSRRESVILALEPRVLLSSYYVSTAGSDGAPGSLSKPFRTIQHAAALAQPGDTVLVRGGIYRETVTPAHSGSSSSPITFKPYNNEAVTVSGANVLTGWSSYKNSAYQARQSWDLGAGKNQVFVDGQMMIEARWPNTTLDVVHPRKANADNITVTSAAGADPATATLTDSSLTQAAGAWDGATIHLMPGHGWLGETGVVIHSEPGKLTFRYKPLDQKNQVPRAGDEYYLTGKAVALDAAGEWFRDPSSGTLYLRTPKSDNPSNHTVEVKRRQYAFDLRGRSYVNVQGFNLFASTIATSGSSKHVTLSRLNAKYVSHFTLQPDPWGQQQKAQTSGIFLLGSDSVIKDSRIDFSAGNGVFLGGTRNRVENCVISNVDYNAGDEAAVYTLGPDHVVTHNTIFNAGRSGVVHRYSPGATITYNVIHDVMLQTTDGGGTYTWGSEGADSSGRWTEIAYNLIYNIHTGGFGAAGVYLDNSSTHHVVHHNLVYNTDYALKMNPPNKVNYIYNNTLGGTKYSVASSGDKNMTGSVFKNNIFLNSVQIGPGATVKNNGYRDTDWRFWDLSVRDYRLRSDSPAIDKGLVLAPYTNGYAGRAPDLGAFEYGRSAWTAGARVT